MAFEANDRVRHKAGGWQGTVLGGNTQGLVNIRPDRGGPCRFYQEGEFEPVPATAQADPDHFTGDIFRPKRPGFGAGVVERPAGALDVRERYLRDPVFHHMVQTLLAAIRGGNYTPSEVREAAMLAQVIYEQETIRPLLVPMDPDPRD